MSRKFQLSVFLFKRLEDYGVSPDAVLSHAGLHSSLLREQRIQVTTSELFALWRSIYTVSADPAIGMKLGQEHRVERYDAIAIAALCARDFADSLARMARYKKLTCPENLEIERAGDECSLRFEWLATDDPEPEQLVDFCFTWILSIARRGSGGAINPVRLRLVRPAQHRKLLTTHFGCPVEFGASRNTMVFRAADMSRPFQTHNSELLSLLAPALEKEVAEVEAQRALPEMVKQVVQKRLAGGRPTWQDVGRELLMSPRTVQRRLSENGASFQGIVQGVRYGLACQYLLHSPLELSEVAYLLGFEDTNSFVRAFHSWEGMPPGEWREARRLSTFPPYADNAANQYRPAKCQQN
jgi:AraC-like DNA-binding protein